MATRIDGTINAAEEEEAEADGYTEDKEEQLLRAARSDDIVTAERLINENPSLDLNCKGRKKWNCHWTPLHLSSYFGHVRTARILLENGANPSEQNAEGDTPLHKAALTNREPLVMLLLSKGADVFLTNQDGRTPRNIASEMYIKNIIMAAELADKKRKKETFFQAVKDGDLSLLQAMFCDSRSRGLVDVNSVDIIGNSALHIAAHRDQRAIAVLLLQCGADPNLMNRRAESPADLAQSEEMSNILKVAPLKEIKRNVSRIEGPLVRRTKFLGKQMVWTVLERGVLSFYRNRADASTGSRRKHFHYLDGATALARDRSRLDVVLAGGSRESLWATTPLDRNRWLKSIDEHIEFGSNDVGSTRFHENEQTLAFGGLEDALLTAEAQHRLLCSEVTEAGKLHTTYLSASLEGGAFSIKAQNISQNLRAQFEQITAVSESTLRSLETCLLLMKQVKEVESLPQSFEWDRLWLVRKINLNRLYISLRPSPLCVSLQNLTVSRESEIQKNQLLREMLEALALKNNDNQDAVRTSVIEKIIQNNGRRSLVDTLSDTSTNHADDSWESAVS